MTEGISLKMCILCVCVKINKHLFEPFCVWISEETVATCSLMDQREHCGGMCSERQNGYLFTTGSERTLWWNEQRDRMATCSPLDQRTLCSLWLNELRKNGMATCSPLDQREPCGGTSRQSGMFSLTVKGSQTEDSPQALLPVLAKNYIYV